jgi:hypothetical protein
VCQRVDVLGPYIYSASKCLLWLKVFRQEKDDTDKNAVINVLLPLILLWGNVALSKVTSALWPIAVACIPHSAKVRVKEKCHEP